MLTDTKISRVTWNAFSLGGFPNVAPNHCQTMWNSLKGTTRPLVKSLTKILNDMVSNTGRGWKWSSFLDLFGRGPTLMTSSWNGRKNKAHRNRASVAAPTRADAKRTAEVFKILPTGTYICKWAANVGVQILGYMCQDRGDRGSMCLFLDCTFYRVHFYFVSFPETIISHFEL